MALPPSSLLPAAGAAAIAAEMAVSAGRARGVPLCLLYDALVDDAVAVPAAGAVSGFKNTKGAVPPPPALGSLPSMRGVATALPCE